MQGRRSIFDPFSESVDLNQGSASNITGTNESEDWNTMLSPMERRLLNNDLSSELNFSCVNTSGYRSSRSFSSWDVGESSSRANTQDQVFNDDLKAEQNLSSSFGTRDSRLEERQLESSNMHSGDGFSGGHLAVGPLNMQSSGSTHVPLNVSLNVGLEGSSSVDRGHGVGFTNLYKSGSPETEVTALSAGIGTSSAGGSDSSSGSWGPSCKRKALEGTSGQSFTSGSSSFFPQENIVRPTAPVCYNGISISPPLVSPLSMNRQEQLNTRNGNGLRGVASNAFAPSSLPGVPESESTERNFGTRESIPPNISSNTNPTPRSNITSSQQSSRRITLTEFLEQRSRVPVTTSANSSNPSYQQPPPSMHVPGIPRNLLPFPSGGNITSGSGSSSSSAGFPGSTLRNNVQHHNFVPSNEGRNLVQDPTSWSLATGSTSTNGGGASSSSRTAAGSGSGSGSRSRSSTTLWLPHHNPTTQSHQRLSEAPPWNLFPTAEPESGGQIAHFPSFPSGSSSASEDNLIPTRINRQGPRHRSHSRSALLMGDTNWRALAADIEGRQRLVSEMRQVLNAIRRGDNLRPEDYVLFDPFIHGFAELHDRHRDMRLDVDNMSYEELLALEERIGNVNTGLSDEVILKLMKQRKHIAFMAISPPNLEPCCICQEQYNTGDDIGTLDCGHDFHTDCVKKWLAQKNVCPICKMTGLSA